MTRVGERQKLRLTWRCPWRIYVAMMTILLAAAPATAQYGGPALVEVTPVVERQVATGQTYVGTVMPTQRAVVGSAVDGRVVEFLVEEGDRVEAGGPLAKLLTETVVLDREAAQAELELRKQELAELANGTRPDELEQARARMEATTIMMEYLEKERQRLTGLYRRGATSNAELEEAVAAALEAKQRNHEAQAAHQLAMDGPRKEKIAQAKARVAMQDALVRRLTDQIRKHTIISRFAGYVSSEYTEVGQWVSQGDPVAEVVALDEVDILAHVVETHVPYIHTGDSVRVEVPALPNETLTGKVWAIVPQADVRSRTFPVKVRVANKVTQKGGPVLKGGQLARVTLATGELRAALLVPKDALVLGGESPRVWIVESNSVVDGPGGMQQANAKSVPVQLGIAEGQLIQVDGDLRKGNLVVVKGNERIPGGPQMDKPRPVTWKHASAPPTSQTLVDRENHAAD